MPRNFYDMVQTGMCNDTHRDEKLQLELAEHALLRSMGWIWYTNGHGFWWKAPANHKGSQSVYSTRSHAINSVKRHVLGFDRSNSRSEWES